MLKFTLILALGLSAIAGPVLHNKIDSDDRIIGGETAAKGQFPYQAYLKRTGIFWCGASIIGRYWILTAAHCLRGLTSPDKLSVVVGTNSRISGGVTHKVKKIVMHREDDPQILVNDIALLKLATPITYNNLVKPAKLPKSDIPEGTSCVVSGWGRYNNTSLDLPIDLQFVSTKSVSLENCQKALEGATQREVFPSNFCALESEGRGACNGDSGGPLLCNGEQHGIVSWGIPCARGIPDVFAKVAFYRKWIKSNTGM